MKAYVITIEDMPRSVKVAERCIASGRQYGVEVERSPAFTPQDGPLKEAEELGYPLDGFIYPHHRLDACVATFLSHSGLWAECAHTGEPFLILEHDAFFIKALPPGLEKVQHFCNLGKPSFGRYRRPRPGYGPFTSRSYVGGAHGYLVTPVAATEMLEKARREAQPTDIFLRPSRFPWMEEYYPWPIVCKDSFSTIQKELGCRAKHNEVKPV